jgi:hypothetical protein
MLPHEYLRRSAVFNHYAQWRVNRLYWKTLRQTKLDFKALKKVSTTASRQLPFWTSRFGYFAQGACVEIKHRGRSIRVRAR